MMSIGGIIDVLPNYEWQNAISQTAGIDETVTLRFRPPTTQNRLLSVIDEQIMWLGRTFSDELTELQCPVDILVDFMKKTVGGILPLQRGMSFIIDLDDRLI